MVRKQQNLLPGCFAFAPVVLVLVHVVRAEVPLRAEQDALDAARLRQLLYLHRLRRDIYSRAAPGRSAE